MSDDSRPALNDVKGGIDDQLRDAICEHLLNWDPAKSQEGMSNPLDGCTLRDGDRTALHGHTVLLHMRTSICSPHGCSTLTKRSNATV